MQIVIDIPKYIVDMCNECGCVIDADTEKVGKAIKNGTPLPKGHGRLGDLDTLEKEMINGIKAGNYEDGYDNYSHINNMDDCVECVKYADTIIKADRGGIKCR